MAKMNRERAVKEKQAKKQERRELKKAIREAEERGETLAGEQLGEIIVDEVTGEPLLDEDTGKPLRKPPIPLPVAEDGEGPEAEKEEEF
ncbi:MAG: hypothetical protein ACRDKK_04500 [Gaiellaceae bacterium]